MLLGVAIADKTQTGTPFCITVDHDTLNDDTVTIRHRDSMQQERVKIKDLSALISKAVLPKYWLEKC